MNEIYQQIDCMGFHIGTTVNNGAGAIDTSEPVFDKKTEKAKWDCSKWVIKSIIEWELKEGEILNGGVVDKIEKPSNCHTWNFDKKEWEFSTELRKSEIITELESLDTQTIRPLRAVMSGLGTDVDKAKLAELETKAKALRTELSTL